MDRPSIDAVASMANCMSAEAIVRYYKEKGFEAKIVTGGLYPIGIEIDSTTMFVPALQPPEVKVLQDD